MAAKNEKNMKCTSIKIWTILLCLQKQTTHYKDMKLGRQTGL